VGQRSPRGSGHVHQNRALDYLHGVARDPAIRLIHGVARGDVVPPAVGGAWTMFPKDIGPIDVSLGLTSMKEWNTAPSP
jgi:hypothetical protein